MIGNKITITTEDGIQRDYLVVTMDKGHPDDPNLSMTIRPVEPGTVDLPDPAPVFQTPPEELFRPAPPTFQEP